MKLLSLDGRAAAFFALLASACAIGSTYLVLDAARFSLPTLLDPVRLWAQGPRGATLIRFACVTAVMGYLALMPVALYLRRRLHEFDGLRMATAAAFLLIYLGIMSAAGMAFVGAPFLLRGAVYKGPQPWDDFASVYGVLVTGIWETAVPVLAALWLVPAGLAARRQGAPLLGTGLILAGGIGLIIPLANLIGIPPGLWPR